MKKNKKGLVFLSGLGIAAGAAALGYFLKNKKYKITDDYSISSDCEDEIFFNFSEKEAVDYDHAETLALEKARTLLGKGASVVSASDKKALTVNIGGEGRHCFMFGAVSDNLSVIPETLLIYVDAANGDVFISVYDVFIAQKKFAANFWFFLAVEKMGVFGKAKSCV